MPLTSILWKLRFCRYNLLFFIAFLGICSSTIEAQNQLPIKQQIIIQDAFSHKKLFGTRLVIQALHPSQQIISSDSLGGTMNIQAKFNPSLDYRIKVFKRKYHYKDTLLKVDPTQSTIYISLYPKRCFNLKTYLKDQYSHNSIVSGNIRLLQLQDSVRTNFIFNQGIFNFCGSCRQGYEMRITSPNYIPEKVSIRLQSNNCFQEKAQEQILKVALTPSYSDTLQKGGAILLPTLLFLNDGLDLSIEAFREIKRLAKWIKAYPNQLLSIRFMAAYYPQRPYNRRLAERRARIVERQLIEQGVGSHRFILKCQGWVDRSLIRFNKNQQVYLKLINS